MSDVESTTHLLSTLSDFKLCNSDLSNQIRNLLLSPFSLAVPNTSRTRRLEKAADSIDLKAHATKYGSFAMRIINQNTAKMNTLKTRNTAEEDLAEATHCLIDSSFCAIEALDKMREHLNIKSLELEKATSNLITLSIDFRMYTKGLDELRKLRDRLIVASGGKPNSTKRTGTASARGGKTNARVRTVKSTTRKPKNSPEPSGVDSVTSYAEYFDFPLNDKCTDRELILLILACQLNVIRCLSEIDYFGFAKVYLEDLCRKDGNAFDWCMKLKAINQENASKQTELMFRALQRVAAKVNSENGLYSFKLRSLSMRFFYESTLFSVNEFCDLVVKTAITYDKSVPKDDSKYQSLLIYFKQMGNLLSLHTRDVESSPKLLAFREYYIHVAKKLNDMDSVKAANNLVVSMNPPNPAGQESTSGKSLKNSSASLNFASTVLQEKLSKPPNRGKEPHDPILVLDEAFKVLSIALADFGRDGEENTLDINEVRRFLRSIDMYRKSHSAFISKEQGETTEMCKLTSKSELVLFLAIEVACNACSTNGVFGIPGMLQPDSDKIGLNLVDFVVFQARMMFEKDTTKSTSKILLLLDKAASIGDSTSSREGIKWVASSCYNFGIALYKCKNYPLAITYLSKSCQLLEQFAEAKASNLEAQSKSDLWMQLNKRYEALGICQQAIGDFKNAQWSFAKSMVYIPEIDTKPLQNSKSTAPLLNLINPLVSRYIKAGIHTKDQTYRSLYELPQMESIEKSNLGYILEKEMYFLEIFGAHYPTQNPRQSIIERTLDIYVAEEYPIRRARVLIEKCKISRFSQADGEGTLKLSQEALELLKNEPNGEDISLDYLRNHYLAIAFSWNGILLVENEQYDPKPFRMALQLWNRLMSDLPWYGNGKVSVHSIAKSREIFGDVEALYAHLYMLTEYFGILEQYVYQIMCLRLMLKLNNIRKNNSEAAEDTVKAYMGIGDSYLRLGYTGQSGLALSQAKSLLDSSGCSADVKLMWFLNYARYLCTIGNEEKCLTAFNSARNFGEEWIAKSQDTNSKRAIKKLLGKAYYVRSIIMHRMGFLDFAIIDATKSLRFLSSIAHSYSKAAGKLKQGQIEMDSTLGLDSNGKKSYNMELHGLLGASSQWEVVKDLLDLFSHTSRLHEMRGSIKEAEYFNRRGLELAQATRSHGAMNIFLLSDAELAYRKYLWNESREALNQVVEHQAQMKDDVFNLDQAMAYLNLGELNLRQEEYEEALESFEMAEEKITASMDEEFIKNLEELSLPEWQTPREKRMIDALPTELLKSDPLKKSKVQFECSMLSHLHGILSCRLGGLFIKNGDLQEGEKIMDLVDTRHQLKPERAEFELNLARIKLQEAASLLESHQTLRMLQDSVLVLPVLEFSSQKVVKRRGRTETTIANIGKLFDQAQEYLHNAYCLAFDSAIPYVIHEVCLARAALFMLKTYSDPSTHALSLDTSLMTAFTLEMTKAVTARREFLSLLRSRLGPQTSDDDYCWPDEISNTRLMTNQEARPSTVESDYKSEILDYYERELLIEPEEFQDKFINGIPDEWTVCSMSVDLEREMLYIVRYRAMHVPTVLRLPMRRHFLREGEEGSFSFKEAFDELQKILHASDQTTSKDRRYETREEKLAWWEERKDLDTKLKLLLDNLEKYWLGGFKNILVPGSHASPKCIEEFSMAVHNLLLRTAAPKSIGKVRQVMIDNEIAQSLLLLGSNAKDTDIEDVIYFLLDIYMYSGVPVEFDEIDFDELIEDFKSTILSFASHLENPTSDSHMILILDKHLQAFPWESTNVLRSVPVSRLPSLSFLRDRILHTKCASKNNSHKLYVDPKHTSYILNPSGDLKSTQKEFEDFLKSKQTWNGIIERTPTETEWEDALLKNEIYLYFGHGGGEQYIRGQRIRQLERCAVTFLLGCSSGHLRPAGEFDPTGTAMNYIIAGCPSLVANLWDVTDKDIDRFSIAMFEEWGLSESGDSENETSIAHAVTKARNACTLKYLIGAAPIVYGIPSYLKRT
ncbi:separin protein [Basidiobolus ranarum]|uniref:separase n=1 Tax=Basidiobolus ranarum TaxID=34480 RepID=A0ABR2W6B6_9FUNG